MVQFLFEFEDYFDHVCKAIDLKRTNNTRLQQVKDAMTVAYDLSSASEQEVDKLKTRLQEYTDKKALLDDQIAQRRENIVELNKEIDNLEKEKNELVWEKSLPTREMIDKEAIKGVEHVEVTLNLGLEINSLEEVCDLLTARLDFSKTKLEEFKSKFPI